MDAERGDVGRIAGREYLRKLIWQVAVFFRGSGGQLRFDGQPIPFPGRGAARAGGVRCGDCPGGTLLLL